MDKFYVYRHIDPETKETVYVGKGVHGRAWDVTRSRTNQAHSKWMIEMCDKGWLPSDWVKIEAKNLSEKQAFEVEASIMHQEGRTKFNKQAGENNHQSKLTDTQAKEIYIKCKHEKIPHKELADAYGVSRSAISMIATRRQWKTTTAGL